MGKPAARVTDLISNAGMITGPGAPTVLINGLPAARVGVDMHTTPMVIPGTPPIPMVGGPIIGPGCPTTIIVGMPAAVMTDMVSTVGPPGTIITGSPNVFIGSGGGGGGGSGGSSSATEKTIQELKSGEIEPIQGSESFPIEVQAVLLEAAKSLPKGAVENALKEHSKSEDPKRLFISDFVEKFKDIEKKEGYEAVRFAAGEIDYSMLCGMARLFVEGIDTDPKNDPNQMPTRFMILFGADDSKLKEIDKHPDSFDGQPENKLTVTNLRKGLKLLGYEVKETGPFDDELYTALYHYNATIYCDTDDSVDSYAVQSKETLGKIAAKFYLPSWKYLYEINKAKIGDNPDMLKPGTELTIPKWESTSLAQMLKEKEQEPEDWFSGMHYRNPWVAFSASMVRRTGAIHTEKDPAGNQTTKFREPKSWAIRDNKTGNVLSSGKINESDELQTLVPDSHDAVLEIDGRICQLKL